MMSKSELYDTIQSDVKQDKKNEPQKVAFSNTTYICKGVDPG